VQYRSVIFYHTAKQKEEAKRVLHEEQKKYSGNKEKFHTKIVPAGDVVIAQRYCEF
jgi:peptide methionine sulfoxide reductase MsrA